MRILYYYLILFFIAGTAVAQQITVSGTVTDRSNLPLPGVNIVVKGTTNGTQTDFDGNYSLKTSIGNILVYNYVGYETKEVRISQNSTVINVQLNENISNLEEIVVTGYSISKKSYATGSMVKPVARIKTNIHNRSGKKSQGLRENSKTIKVRGASNLSQANQPLYIVDGVPIAQKDIMLIEAIKPDKISKVKVYKSRQAQSIFGSEAKNGCVVITTHAGNYRVENEESYKEILENEFQNVQNSPLSTFSIDVDKASYSNVRRMINNGSKVPVDAVKIEEMINYFEYAYRQPKGPHPFAIHTEYGVAPWNLETQLVKIGIKGKEIPQNNIPPSNLVFLIDVSGSMGDYNKLPLLKKAFKLLVNQLREKDKVSIVVYAGAAGMVLNPTSGAYKNKIMKALDNLEAGGSTAGGAGIQLAYKIAKDNFIKNGNNRVILATDGDFNVGMSSDREMISLIEEKRESGVFLTCLGFGMGNYKDSKLEALADKGNGNHAYIDTMQEAQKVLGTEFGGTLFTIAKDVKIQVEFNHAKVQAYRLIGYENRLLVDEDFVDDTKDAGELGSGHTVTALYEVIPVGVKSEYIKNVSELKYTKNNINKEFGDELLTVKFRYKKPSEYKSIEIVHVLDAALQKEPSQDFRFAASVAWFGMKLRNSKYIKNTNLADIAGLAQANKQFDDHGYKAEFVRLINSYQGL